MMTAKRRLLRRNRAINADLDAGGGVFAQTYAILGAGGLDYAFYDSGLMASLFQDAAGTVPVTAITQPVGRHNARQKAPHYASQATGVARPALEPNGLKYDGLDDNLLADYLVQPGSNCIIFQVTMPSGTIPTQVFGGGRVSTTERFWVGCNADGLISAGVGSQGQAAINGGADRRGQSIVAALSIDGTTVKLFDETGQIYSSAQSGGPAVDTPVRIGTFSENTGTGGSFTSAAVKRFAYGKTALTLAQFQTIRAEWLAAA